MPLLHIWNTQYAQHSASLPPLESCDFTRLYTNIQTSDMKLQIMGLIIRVFALQHHLLHVGLKVWETRPGVWLNQQQMPDNEPGRLGTGNGGKNL